MKYLKPQPICALVRPLNFELRLGPPLAISHRVSLDVVLIPKMIIANDLHIATIFH